MDSSRRDFFRKSFGVMGVAATTVVLSKISFNEAQALEIGQTGKNIKDSMEVQGQCGMGFGCSGGGGQCGMGFNCGGGGSGGSGQCGMGFGCSGQ